MFARFTIRSSIPLFFKGAAAQGVALSAQCMCWELHNTSSSPDCTVVQLLLQQLPANLFRKRKSYQSLCIANTLDLTEPMLRAYCLLEVRKDWYRFGKLTSFRHPSINIPPWPAVKGIKSDPTRLSNKVAFLKGAQIRKKYGISYCTCRYSWAGGYP